MFPLWRGEQVERILDFMMVAYGTEASLAETLLTGVDYDYLASPDYAVKANVRPNFLSAVEAAERSDWQRLFTFCIISRRYFMPAARNLGDELFEPEEVLGFKLIPLLEDLKLAVEQVADAVAALDVTADLPLPPKADGTLLYYAHSVCAAQANARRKPVVAAFLTNLGDATDAAGKAKIAMFWAQARATIDLPGDVNQDRGAGDRGTGPYSVAIELTVATESTPSTPTWTPNAFLYDHGSKKWKPITVQRKQQAETLGTMPEYLRTLRDELARVRVPLDRVTFEFFVSLKQLAQAIDQWDMLVGGNIKRPLGRSNPVVIRLLEPSEERNREVEKRWVDLRQAATFVRSKGPPVQWTKSVVVADHEGDAGLLWDHYSTTPELQCLLLDAPLTGAHDPDDCAAFSAAVHAGVPIILWARDAAVIDQLQLNAAEHLLAAEPAKVREATFRLRKANAAKDLCCHLSLFCEGDYWPSASPFTEFRR